MKSLISLVDLLAMFGVMAGFAYAGYLQLVKDSQSYERLVRSGYTSQEAQAFVNAYGTHQSAALIIGCVSLCVAIGSAIFFKSKD